MTQLTQLEHAVVEKLLQGEHPVLANLRDQLRECSVVRRELTGVGFYTYFNVATPSAPEPRNLRLDDVAAEIAGLRNGAGFILYVANGRLDLLEGYCFDEPWPREIDHFNLRYTADQPRNLEALLRSVGSGG
jgi:hypothetical protein